MDGLLSILAAQLEWESYGLEKSQIFFFFFLISPIGTLLMCVCVCVCV